MKETQVLSVLEQEQRFITSAWITDEEVLCRIESNVLEFLQEMLEAAATKSDNTQIHEDDDENSKMTVTSMKGHSFKIVGIKLFNYYNQWITPLNENKSFRLDKANTGQCTSYQSKIDREIGKFEEG